MSTVKKGLLLLLVGVVIGVGCYVLGSNKSIGGASASVYGISTNVASVKPLIPTGPADDVSYPKQKQRCIMFWWDPFEDGMGFYQLICVNNAIAAFPAISPLQVKDPVGPLGTNVASSIGSLSKSLTSWEDSNGFCYRWEKDASGQWNATFKYQGSCVSSIQKVFPKTPINSSTAPLKAAASIGIIKGQGGLGNPGLVWVLANHGVCPSTCNVDILSNGEPSGGCWCDDAAVQNPNAVPANTK